MSLGGAPLRNRDTKKLHFLPKFGRERERVFDFGKSVPSKYYDKTENPLKDSGEVSAVFECILVVLLSTAETHSE